MKEAELNPRPDSKVALISDPVPTNGTERKLYRLARDMAKVGGHLPRPTPIFFGVTVAAAF